MGLINKLKEKGRIGLIVGSLGLAGIISLEGCEMTPEQAKGAKVLGVLAQMSPYTTPAQRLAGAGMSAAADYDHDMHTAREGRGGAVLRSYNKELNEFGNERPTIEFWAGKGFVNEQGYIIIPSGDNEVYVFERKIYDNKVEIINIVSEVEEVLAFDWDKNGTLNYSVRLKNEKPVILEPMNK